MSENDSKVQKYDDVRHDTNASKESNGLVGKNDKTSDGKVEGPDKEEGKEDSPSCLRPLLGLGICFCTSLMFALCNIIVKESENLSTFTLATFRNISVLLYVIPVIIDRDVNVFPKGHRILLILRGLVGTTALLCHFYAIKHMPIADAVMITATTPAISAVFSRIFAREPISLLSVVNLVLALVGVALVVRPTFLFGGDPTHSDPEYPYAAAGAAVGAVCQGAMHVVLRLLREAHFACVLACFGAVSTAVTAAGGLAPLPFGGSLCVPECGAGRLAVVAIGVLTFFGQIGLTTAPKLESAAVVSLFIKMSDVLLALLIQTLWFKMTPGLYSGLGAVVILMVIVSSGGKRVLDDLPSDHWLKLRYLYWCYPEEKVSKDNVEAERKTDVDNVVL